MQRQKIAIKFGAVGFYMAYWVDAARGQGQVESWCLADDLLGYSVFEGPVCSWKGQKRGENSWPNESFGGYKLLLSFCFRKRFILFVSKESILGIMCLALEK
jgi:hypothetical protein